MKRLLKRFKLGEWLVVCQLFSSIVALIMSTANNYIADAFGLVWNIFNAFALLIVFLRNNARNYKSYEVTGQFIFNKLGSSFSDFMDFLMSDEYQPNSFEEQALLQDKLLQLAKNGEYDTKRKLARALPNLYEIDKKMAYDIACALRQDIIDGNTDIRRRTIESLLQMIQKEDGKKRQKKVYLKYKNLFEYYKMDDSYTIVASIENYFYCYAFIAGDKKGKQKVLSDFSSFKEDVKMAFSSEIGRISDSLIEEMDLIWETLNALYCIGHSNSKEYAVSKQFIDDVLKNGGKFSKLVVVKNLYYSCSYYPHCLCDKSCSAISSKYMMEKINGFLTTAMEGDIFLSMPTVRYFDCVCNNFRQRECSTLSHNIIQKYYTHSDLLINQTAFDKFAKLMIEDPSFGNEVLGDLLENNELQLSRETETIVEKISVLPEEEQQYFSVMPGRTKIKRLNVQTYKERLERENHEKILEIDKLLDVHYERIRFVGQIKKKREEIYK